MSKIEKKEEKVRLICGARLEIVCALTAHREFESPPLRQTLRGYRIAVTLFYWRNFRNW